MMTKNQIKRRITSGLDEFSLPVEGLLRRVSSIKNPRVPFRLATARGLEIRGLLKFTEVVQISESSYPQPRVIESDKDLIARFPQKTWEAVGVMEIPEGRVSTRHGLPLVADNTLIIDGTINLSGRSSALFYDIYRDEGIASERKLAGTTLNLVSAWSCVNYAHFLLDTLSRVHLLEQAGYSWNDFDTIVLPEYRTDSINRIIDCIGIPRAKVTSISRTEMIKCERLIQTSHPCANQMRNYPDWVPDYLRRKTRITCGDKFRRLFLARPSGQRGLREEGEIIKLLKKYRFEIVDPASSDFQLEWLAEAECVVGIHGAGLANCAFCVPGSTLIEILPYDWQFPYYYSLACGNKMNYFAMLGSKVGADGKFSVDVQKLARVLASAEAKLLK